VTTEETTKAQNDRARERGEEIVKAYAGPHAASFVDEETVLDVLADIAIWAVAEGIKVNETWASAWTAVESELADEAEETAKQVTAGGAK